MQNQYTCLHEWIYNNIISTDLKRQRICNKCGKKESITINDSLCDTGPKYDDVVERFKLQQIND